MKYQAGKQKPKERAPQSERRDLEPLDLNRRYTIEEACERLNISGPTFYKLVKSGELETYKEGRRRYATGRGIAALSLPPTARPTLDASHRQKIEAVLEQVSTLKPGSAEARQIADIVCAIIGERPNAAASAA
jgi:excisionase family DNA binding protein